MTGPGEPRLRRTRPTLDRERIAKAALNLIDRSGLAALSTRRLGTALGVEAMSIYHHFPSKAHLLDAVAEALVLEVRLPAAAGSGPAAADIAEQLATQLAEIARSYRRVAHDHPRAFVLLATRRFNSPGSLRFLEAVLGLLERGGLDARDRGHLCRLFGYYVNGAGLAEIATRGHEPDAAPERLLQQNDSPERYPLSRQLASTITPDHLEDLFEEGLALLVAEFHRRAGTRSLAR